MRRKQSQKQLRGSSRSAPALKARRDAPRDAQLEEFERKDLGDDIRASGSMIVVTPTLRTAPIFFDTVLVEKLRKKGAKRGLGYERLAELIVREHLDDY